MHYQEFNVNTSKNQQVSLSISPENSDETIDYVAFAFVYGYNENEMTVTNAELNILATGYVTTQSEDSKDDSSVSAGNDSECDTEVDDYFAHVVHVNASLTTDRFYGKKGKKVFISYPMWKMDDTMGIPNDQFEDNTNVFRWRYDTAFALSKRIYRCWIGNKKIKSITASTRNESYTYKTISSYWYNKTGKRTKKVYENRYWIITSSRYFYVLSTY